MSYAVWQYEWVPERKKGGKGIHLGCKVAVVKGGDEEWVGGVEEEEEGAR